MFIGAFENPIIGKKSQNTYNGKSNQRQRDLTVEKFGLRSSAWNDLTEKLVWSIFHGPCLAQQQ